MFSTDNSPKTAPSVRFANVIEPSSETTLSLPFRTMYISFPIGVERRIGNKIDKFFPTKKFSGFSVKRRESCESERTSFKSKLTYIAFPTNVVARREDLETQLEH